MSEIRQTWLVFYDIAHERRLRRAARVALDYGVRVQKSVYACRVTETALRRFQHRLLAVLKLDEDRVHYVHLCPRDVRAARQLGVTQAYFERENSPAHWVV